MTNLIAKQYYITLYVKAFIAVTFQRLGNKYLCGNRTLNHCGTGWRKYFRISVAAQHSRGLKKKQLGRRWTTVDTATVPNISLGEVEFDYYGK